MKNTNQKVVKNGKMKLDVRSEQSLYITFPNGKTYYIECSEATDNKLHTTKI